MRGKVRLGGLTASKTPCKMILIGQTVDEHLILNKAGILQRAVEKEGLTLAHSIGVGDTESDVAFLKLVERPICFNPNKKLYDYAKRKGWEVVVERKDMIYFLQ